MTSQTQDPSGGTPGNDDHARRRFRDTIERVHAHQPAATLRALAKDLWDRSHRH